MSLCIGRRVMTNTRQVQWFTGDPGKYGQVDGGRWWYRGWIEAYELWSRKCVQLCRRLRTGGNRNESMDYTPYHLRTRRLDTESRSFVMSLDCDHQKQAWFGELGRGKEVHNESILWEKRIEADKRTKEIEAVNAWKEVLRSGYQIGGDWTWSIGHPYPPFGAVKKLGPDCACGVKWDAFVEVSIDRSIESWDTPLREKSSSNLDMIVGRMKPRDTDAFGCE
jgi:hypothetical protein